MQSLETGVLARDWEAVGRLDLAGRGFCTGALITDDIVVTAAHCLYDKRSGQRFEAADITFLAGWRNGRAAAYRSVRRALVHPRYQHSTEVSSARVRSDLAILQLERPIRNTTITPFFTGADPRPGTQVAVVSYARDRAEAAALQEVCSVLARHDGVLVTSCSVDPGASGAPIFDLSDGSPKLVSIVSAKAELDGSPVALAAPIGDALAELRGALSGPHEQTAAGLRPDARIRVGGGRHATGAKFVRPDG